MNYNDICLNAEKVRNVIELNWSNAPCVNGFCPFPKGWCEIATDIVGAHLKRLDPDGNYEKVSGIVGEYTHSWLEYNGYIIDITADQFKEFTNQPVIVEKVGDSLTHKRFTIEERMSLYTKDIYLYQPESYLLMKLLDNN